MKSRVRASAVIVQGEKLLTFRAQDPSSGRSYFFLPGGKIEPHETAPEAAERETLEETGFKVRVNPLSALDREYFFFWNGEDYDCLTIFYWATLESPIQSPVNDAPMNKGTVWIPLSEIETSLSYSREISSAVMELIQKYHATYN
ncbi:MAG: hypothetical protein C5B49_09555 [Bdellovibrio sp.]|nr:MAG: hypothetical protein C5B49_09555 [Bdellovibrio sp.]